MDITTLIPAYKPKYLSDLLMALSRQTYRPRRILISDDSPGGDFKNILSNESLRKLINEMSIEVIDGPRSGGRANFRHLLRQWNESTELVHILCDDDIIYPDFYEQHLAVHGTGSIDCSVSRRWTADESGRPIGSLAIPREITRHPNRTIGIDPDFAFQSIVPRCNNWMGEFSNAVLNAKIATQIHEYTMADISFQGLGDIGLFLSATLQRPICWINETLGFFRINEEQNTQQMEGRVMMTGHLAWIALAIAAKRLGRLNEEQVRQCVATISPAIEARYSQSDAMVEFVEMLPGLRQQQAGSEDRFVKTWHQFLFEV